MPRDVVIAGASLAGLRAAERLRAEGFEGRLTLVGAEARLPYDRPPLSKELLAGTRAPEELTFPGTDALEAEWVLGDAATRLDLERRRVETASGLELPFDGLVIATGSAPRRLPALDPARPGVHELRTLDDALALREVLRPGARLAIIGSGFIGVELASTARALGADVAVASLDPPLAVAGELVSTVAALLLAEHDVELHVGRRVERALGDDRVEGIVLDDGTELAADATVVAIGAAPATGWLEGSGLRLEDGVVCDACCRALGAEGVVAAGDVARWPNPLFPGATMRIEHWTNAGEQAAAAARALLRGDGPAAAYAAVPSFWSDHFGVRVQSVGLPGLADRFEIVEGSIASRHFGAAAYRGDELVGAIAYDLPRALLPFRMQLMRRGADGVETQSTGSKRKVAP